MSRSYDDVMLWTDAALECSHEYLEDTYYPEYHHRWREDQRLDYQRLHLCRALALKHTRDLVGAVENMEMALTFDPGDGNVFAQLTLLKRQLKEYEARRSRAIRRNLARGANARQDQLRKKQAARRIKAGIRE